jgi:hypothetical protein
MQPIDGTNFRTLVAEFYIVIEDLYKSGGAEPDVRKTLDLSKWKRLGRYEDMMGRNISRVWFQVEADNYCCSNH